MIEATHLTKRYGKTVAVNEISFTVRPGQVTGFLGPNGAGKTTTMRIILGLDTPTAGRALVGGHPYRGIIRPLHQVGSLLDAGAMHPGRLTADHLIIIGRGRLLANMPTAEFIDANAPGDV